MENSGSISATDRFLGELRMQRSVALALFGTLVVAMLLRLYGINQPFIDAFSWRQSSTAMMAENFFRTNWNILYPEVNWSGPNPGYQGREFQTITYLAALLYPLFGQEDWIGRGLAAMFGVWGVFALFLLTRRVWNEEHALASAAMMAILPGSVFIERSFLPDPAMVALVTTSFWLLVVYLQTDRFHYLILAGVIGAWGFCTKIPGLIVGLPMAYAMLAILGWRKLIRPNQLAAVALFSALTLTPVVAYYLWARHLALSYPPYHFAGEGNWLWDQGLTRWFEQRYFVPELAHWVNELLWTVPVTSLVLLGIVVPPPAQETDPELKVRKPRWIFHWWVVAGVVYYIIGAKELVSNPWNFHIVNPAAAALSGHALVVIASFATRRMNRRVAAAATLVVLLVVLAFQQKSFRQMSKPYAYKGHQLGLALRKASRPGDLVVTIADQVGDPVVIYYSRRRGWIFPPARPGTNWGALPESASEAIRLFEELRAEGADWIAMVRKSRYAQDYVVFLEHVNRTGEVWGQGRGWTIYRIRSPQEVPLIPAGE